MSAFDRSLRGPRLPAVVLGLVAWVGFVPDSVARVSCDRVSGFAIANLVCQDRELLQLDQQLDKLSRELQVQAAAGGTDWVTGKAATPGQGSLAGGDTGWQGLWQALNGSPAEWLAARNDCWQSGDPRQCTLRNYQQRIAGLRVALRQVPARRVARFRCGGEALTIQFYETGVPSLRARFRGRDIFMVVDAASGGRRYRHPSLALELGEAGEGLLSLRLPGSAAVLQCRGELQDHRGSGQRRSGFVQCGPGP